MRRLFETWYGCPRQGSLERRHDSTEPDAEAAGAASDAGAAGAASDAESKGGCGGAEAEGAEALRRDPDPQTEAVLSWPLGKH